MMIDSMWSMHSHSFDDCKLPGHRLPLSQTLLALQGISGSACFSVISMGKVRCIFFTKTATKKPEPSISCGFLNGSRECL